ncbi:hypothetical protein [Streptomyces sp. NPDC059349]|uniref:hypothetical protein n=1 Tax=Streptomyces sp. NPDC059349 TaxID=3346808 RepID=UPI0036AA896F
MLAGAPGDDSGAGRAFLLRGGASGLSAAGAVAYVEGAGGVPGTREAGDRFGSAVTVSDLTGDGVADLGIGAEGENAGDGTIMALSAGAGAAYGPTALGSPAGTGIGGRPNDWPGDVQHTRATSDVCRWSTAE